MDVFTMIKHIDYPRDSETRNITAAIHPQVQVHSETYLWHRAFIKEDALKIEMLLS